jgi:purine-binding chemotaxis protein CheW
MNPDDFAASVSPERLAELLAQRAAALAAEPPVQLSGELVQLLAFWLGEEQYAFEIKMVRSIHALAALTPVPRTPAFVKGLFNARGQIISVIDLRLLLEVAASPEAPERPQIIILSPQVEGDPPLRQAQGALEIGIVADEIIDVITVFAAQITPPLLTQPYSRYIRGLTNSGIIILEPIELLTDEHLFVDEELI